MTRMTSDLGIQTWRYGSRIRLSALIHDSIIQTSSYLQLVGAFARFSLTAPAPANRKWILDLFRRRGRGLLPPTNLSEGLADRTESLDWRLHLGQGTLIDLPVLTS